MPRANFDNPNELLKGDNDSNVIIGYHGFCPDGVGAAWVFYHQARIDEDVSMPGFVALTHNTEAPMELFRGKDVILVDFAYSKEVTLKIKEIASSLLVLDHHKTSAIELQGVSGCVFNMKKSGAQIAWDHVFPKQKRPWYINYIADRDLYKWDLPNSKEITKGMYEANVYNFKDLEEIWEDTYKNPKQMRKDKAKFAKIGQTIIERETQFIEKAMNTAVLCDYKDANGNSWKVYLTQCAPCVRSEVGNKLSAKRDCDFACIWNFSLKSNEWWLSLRSCAGKANVGKIAQEFPVPEGKRGGGGHNNAAGVTLHGGNICDYFMPREVATN